MPFDRRLASLVAAGLHRQGAGGGLGVKYVLVGDDFRFGAKRQGDYAMLDAAGDRQGFDVARMNSYEVHGLRVSQLGGARGAGPGRWTRWPRACWGGPTGISGHVVHGRKLGRELGRNADLGVFAP
jgi:riboflavin kinase/FMN adenylyltransferase